MLTTQSPARVAVSSASASIVHFVHLLLRRALALLDRLVPATAERLVDAYLAPRSLGVAAVDPDTQLLAVATAGAAEPAAMILTAAIFFDHVDALVAFLDAASLLAVPLAIRSLQEPACSQLPVMVVLELQSSAPKRKLSVQRLSKLGDPRLSHYADLLVLVLQESQLAAVRKAVLKTLGRLGAASLAQHTPQVIQALDDSSAGVRTVALATLGKLKSVSIAQYTPDVMSMLEDSKPGVVCAALKTLGKLDAAAIEEHASCPTHAVERVAAMLLSDEPAVRRAALKTFGNFGSASPTDVLNIAMGLLQGADDASEAGRLQLQGWTIRVWVNPPKTRTASRIVGLRVNPTTRGQPSREMFAQYPAATVVKMLEEAVIDAHDDDPYLRMFVCCFSIAVIATGRLSLFDRPIYLYD